jgi:hypothetical protein
MRSRQTLPMMYISGCLKVDTERLAESLYHAVRALRAKTCFIRGFRKEYPSDPFDLGAIHSFRSIKGKYICRL